MNRTKSNLNKDIFGREIGRGAHGIVYAIKGNDKQVIKVSDKTNTCRQWSNEYQKINNFMSRIDHLPTFTKFKFVGVVRPTDFVSVDDGTQCFMSMSYIWRPDNKKELPTQQVYLGLPTFNTTFKGRGHFIGLKEVKEIFGGNNYELGIAIYELGQLLSLIHHIGKNDAYDVELFIGKSGGEGSINKFWLADFDLSQEYDTLNKDVIERLTWSMDAVPYFPTDESDPELLKTFIRGYASIIPNNPQLVKEIFVNYG